MNSKTAALLFTILGVGGMLLPGLTLAPTASALPQDEDDEDDFIGGGFQPAIQLALELAENVDDEGEEQDDEEDNRIICIEVEPGLIECFEV